MGEKSKKQRKKTGTAKLPNDARENGSRRKVIDWHRSVYHGVKGPRPGW